MSAESSCPAARGSSRTCSALLAPGMTVFTAGWPSTKLQRGLDEPHAVRPAHRVDAARPGRGCRAAPVGVVVFRAGHRSGRQNAGVERTAEHDADVPPLAERQERGQRLLLERACSARRAESSRSRRGRAASRTPPIRSRQRRWRGPRPRREAPRARGSPHARTARAHARPTRLATRGSSRPRRARRECRRGPGRAVSDSPRATASRRRTSSRSRTSAWACRESGSAATRLDGSRAAAGRPSSTGRSRAAVARASARPNRSSDNPTPY